MIIKSPESFYDDLSDYYHLIFSPWKWDDNINKQADILDNIIKKYLKNTKTILDCSCWIWTQAIWLSKKWYILSATDISEKAINRAKDEAKNRNLDINFWVADIRNLENQVNWTFDTIISCDNSIPHLLTYDDLSLAAKNIYTKLNNGWLFIAWTRDYDEILNNKISNTIPNVKDIENQRFISFQIWDWEEDNIYVVNQFFIKWTDSYDTFLTKTKYKAYKREEITNIFKKAGFVNIKWLMPNESWYHQPLMISFKN